VAAIAALLDTPSALATLRKTLPRSHTRVRAGRTAEALGRTLDGEWVDCLVVGTRSRRAVDLAGLRLRYPAVPVILFGPMRPDEGRTLLDLEADGVEAILVEGVDDPVVGDAVVDAGYLAKRRRALADLPTVLRLTEPVQVRAFDLLLSFAGRPPATEVLAKKLRVSREHLSRQFGAGGAPNLKRVIDLLRLLHGRDLLLNPGFPVPRVVDQLGFSTLSHWRSVVRRLLGLDFAAYRRASTTELVRRFVRAGARSRI
jgi:AraC-like DNA-binding protein